MDGVGDADGFVVVADLGLVVPEHRQPVVEAGAVQPQVDHLTQPSAGRDQRLPDVAQPDVVAVVLLGQPRQVRLVGQRLGHMVGERAAGARSRVGWMRRGDDESRSRSSLSARPVSSAVRSSRRTLARVLARVWAVTVEDWPFLR